MATAAKFDQSAQRRRAMLGKIHIAKKQLQLVEDDYRQILFDETGQRSAANCDQAELEKVIARLKAIGFKPQPKKGAKNTAQHPMAKKARAMWISLHQLGAVNNPSEKALEAFAKRQLGCDRLVWANQSHAYRLIEALKAMASRHGWKQTDKTGNNLSIRELKEGLCEAILAKLIEADEVPGDWTIDIAAFRLCGIETGANGPVTAEGYVEIAAVLGKKLRAVPGAVA